MFLKSVLYSIPKESGSANGEDTGSTREEVNSGPDRGEKMF